MSVEIIAHQNDLLSIGILLIKKPFDAFCPINPCSLLFGFGVSPTCKRLGKQKDAACAIADILIVLITNASTLRCNAIFFTGKSWVFIGPILPVDLVAFGREIRQCRVDQLVRISEIVLQFFF